MGTTLHLSEAARDIIDKRPGQIANFCGNEFIYQIDYGAKLIATMSIEFASVEDRRAFEAAASVDVNFFIGSVSASASMAKMQQRMGSRTRVKVEAHQTGGKPGELAAIINQRIVDCNLNNMQSCLDTFAGVIRYANISFRDQLRDPSNFTPVRFHTMPYEDSGAVALVPDAGFPILDEMVKRKRKQIQEEFEDQSSAYDRATFIKNKLRHFTPQEQMDRVEVIHRKTFDNMTRLTEAMHLCLQYVDERCVNQKLDLVIFDRRDLEVTTTEIVDPHSNLGKLYDAVRRNDVNAAYLDAIRPGGKELITQCDPLGLSACHRAIIKGYREMLSLFIEQDPYPKSDRSVVHAATDNALKYTPLCLAAKGGSFDHVRCINALCDAGAEVDTKTPLGLTPLQVACIEGKVETARELIRRNANKYILDVDNRSLLHLAASAGDASLINFLIDQGISVNARDYQNKTPLHDAATLGHLAAVNALLRAGADHLAEDQNGKMPIHLAAGHADVLARLLDFYDLPLSPYRQLETYVEEVAFSPDDAQLAVSRVGGIDQYNMVTGSCERALSGENEWHYGVAYSSDGVYLVAHDGGHFVKIWEPRSGKHLHSLYTDTSSQNKVAFSPHKDVVVIGNKDGAVTLWSVRRGQKIRTLDKFPQKIDSVAFSPDGTKLAIASKTVALWDPENGQLIRTLLKEASSTTTVAFNRDGTLLGSSADLGNQQAHVWNVETGALVRTLNSGNHGGIAFSPVDDLMVLSYELHGPHVIEFWDTKSWHLLYTTKATIGFIGFLRFNNSGSVLAGRESISGVNLWKLHFVSILHDAIRAGSLANVRLIVERFPLLLYIRTPEGISPLEMAESLSRGNNVSRAREEITTFLRDEFQGR